MGFGQKGQNNSISCSYNSISCLAKEYFDTHRTLVFKMVKNKTTTQLSNLVKEGVKLIYKLNFVFPCSLGGVTISEISAFASSKKLLCVGPLEVKFWI